MSDRWERVNELFHAALQMNVSERARFLESHRGQEDPAVLEEVASLLSAHESAGDFIQTPVTPSVLQAVDQNDMPYVVDTQIGAYKILREIGRGGMGAVYLAERADQTFEKHVAIKLLKRGMDTDELLRRFRNERQILASLEHPNIARLLDGGATESGRPYFVMEYVEGIPIDQYCNRKQLPIPERLELFQHSCAAISYAHRHLVIHRDIKPSNILVTTEGVPKLLDFGIAKTLDPNAEPGSTVTGIRLMTPEYASPEQAVGLPVTTASDVYALGVVLYELLTGHSPFHFPSRSPLEIARVIHDTEPALPSTVTSEPLKRRLRGDLDNIILTAIRKEPERRYQSVEQLSEDIRRHLQGRPVTARRDTLFYRASKFAERNKIAVITAILVVFSLIAGVIGTTWQAHKARAEQERAEYARAFGDELRYIETLLLNTYTAPLHDIRINVGLVRERLKTMEERTARGGEAAYGSGHNALGNAYLLLKDYERAKTHLEKAWQSDYKEPSTAYALGKVLGILYQQALTDADELINHEVKQKMIQDAEKNYAKPAVEYLALARASAESPAYVEGLIALYQKRFGEALEKTKAALRSSSRPYEVMKLEGDIHFAIGRDAFLKGNNETGFMAYSRAGNAYARAQEIARSDPDIYLANAQRLISTIATNDPRAAADAPAAIQLCDNAIKINPDSDRSYLFRSDAFFEQGVFQMYNTSTDPIDSFRMAITAAEEAGKRKRSASASERANQSYLRIGEYLTTIGKDPRPALMRAIEGCQRTLRLSPHYENAYLNMVSAYFYVGEYELEHGQDPTASLTKVLHIYDNDLRTTPLTSYSYNVRGLTHLSLAEYKIKRGGDARADLVQAIHTFQAGIKQNSSAAVLFDGLGLAYTDLAKYENLHGIVPDKSYEEAIQQFNEELKRNPEGGYGIFNRALTYVSRAEYKVLVRQSPEDDLNHATADFKETLKRHPEVNASFLEISTIHFLRARYAFHSGKDPGADLKQAAEALNDFLKNDRENAEAYLAQGKIEALSALWANKNNHNPDPFFNRAIGSLQKCIQLNAQEHAAYLELASIYRFRAEWALHRREAATEWIESGLQQTVEAEKINSENAELFALRARLLLLKSRVTNDAALAERGKQMLQAALQKNPFLKPDYAR